MFSKKLKQTKSYEGTHLSKMSTSLLHHESSTLHVLNTWHLLCHWLVSGAIKKKQVKSKLIPPGRLLQQNVIRAGLWERRVAGGDTGVSHHRCKSKNVLKHVHKRQTEQWWFLWVSIWRINVGPRCVACQALAKKSDAEHNSNAPLKTCVTYVTKPGKAPLMERIVFLLTFDRQNR